MGWMGVQAVQRSCPGHLFLKEGIFSSRKSWGINIKGCKELIQLGTSLVVQWLRLHIANAGAVGLIPGQGTRSHMFQLKNPSATTKTTCSQIIFF